MSSSPLLVSTVTVKFMSGCISFMYALNALALDATKAFDVFTTRNDLIC